MDTLPEKKERKRRRWARGLSRDLVRRILEFNPNKVSFVIVRPREVQCIISTEYGIGRGRAICSVLDEFDEKEGKNKAAGRALKALVRKESNERVRVDWSSFPKSWTKRQIDRLLEAGIYGGIDKSTFIQVH